MLLDNEMLQPSNVGILRREFHSLPERHHPIDCLLGLVKCFVLGTLLIFQSKGLLQEPFHLTHGVAAQN